MSEINVHQINNEILSIKTLLAVTILFLYTIAAPIFEKFKFYYFHESGLSMIIGVIITIISLIVNPKVISIILGIFCQYIIL